MTILDRILKTKREEVEAAKRRRSIDELKSRSTNVEPPRDFSGAVCRREDGPIRIIAEIKKASPSAGVIVAQFDPIAIARTYAQNGAAALSVLTDGQYFQGRLDYIAAIKNEVSLPVLRKDFMIDEYQIYESHAAGADAILLIVEAIGVDGVERLLPISRQLNMTTIVEVHSPSNLTSLLKRLDTASPGSYLLGINNRDLAEQKTNTANAIELSNALGSLNASIPWIAESGIKTRADVLLAEKAGACAVLVGEALLRAADIGVKLRELRGE